MKSEEGRVSFPSKIVQDGFRQGFKTLAFETDDIEKEKQRLEANGVEVIGPIKMDRENKKGDKKTWRLLYIADNDYLVKPPFFIQWDQDADKRAEQLAPLRQNYFTIESINIESTDRAVTVARWQNGTRWRSQKITKTLLN